MPVLNGDCGASLTGMRARVPAAAPTARPASELPRDEARVLAADGSIRAALASWPSELENTVPIICPSFKSPSNLRRRAGSGGATSRGTGVKSSIAWASITPPLPSSAAWWIFEKKPPTMRPSGNAMRSKT
jgi:hypothetical protein